ncbi:hypothetical protein EH223_09200 [candidate division KSB1 bacterium]|nr:hypothetical protein [Candidatus Aminicenantes bacterium]RQW03558.1 MAG: hypothetical protein EH223_09200 [candidate division KSB1 bacterium]
MKHLILFIMVVATVLAAPSGPLPTSSPLTSLFPPMPGWSMEEKAEVYMPETLYEHINGAAENFLSYDFKQLAVRNYTREQKSLSAEIYFHGTPENAFGIYSSEKPLAGKYLPIGSQGYAEEGVLNFVSGRYYVKLNSFGLGPEGEKVLTLLAEKICRAIGAENTLPKILRAFPAAGKLVHSERFILNNFLGHEFLHSAYVADYQADRKKFQLFIIDAGSADQARAMLTKYTALDKVNSQPDIRPGKLFINDPYNGPLQLLWQGKFICGCTGQSQAASALLDETGRHLPK